MAQLLSQPDTTLAAKQFICLQLRQAGTAAEIPLLAQLLQAPDTSQMALYALAAIPGQEATDALRGAGSTRRHARVGVINALGARRDPGCVERLVKLAAGNDLAVRQAVVRALSQIADDHSIAWLRDQAAHAPDAMAVELASGLLRAASCGRKVAILRWPPRCTPSWRNQLSGRPRGVCARRPAAARAHEIY